MELKSYFQKNGATGFFITVCLLMLTSCGSYEYVSYNDGIYDDAISHRKTEPQKNTPVTPQNPDYDPDYFSDTYKKAKDYTEQGDVFTDIDSYSSNTYDPADTTSIALNYETGKPTWGSHYDDISVNVYNTGWNRPFWGVGYGFGGFYDPFWPGGGFGWNFGFTNPYWYGGYYGGFYCPPYYGYGYYNNRRPFFRNRYYAYNRGYRRGYANNYRSRNAYARSKNRAYTTRSRNRSYNYNGRSSNNTTRRRTATYNNNKRTRSSTYSNRARSSNNRNYSRSRSNSTNRSRSYNNGSRYRSNSGSRNYSGSSRSSGFRSRGSRSSSRSRGGRG